MVKSTSKTKGNQRSFLAIGYGSELNHLIANDHPALALLMMAASRARYSSDGFNPYGLEVGQALVGDFEKCGMSTRKQYRCALVRLTKYQLLRVVRTNSQGTVVELSSIVCPKIGKDFKESLTRYTAKEKQALACDTKEGHQEDGPNPANRGSNGEVYKTGATEGPAGRKNRYKEGPPSSDGDPLKKGHREDSSNPLNEGLNGESDEIGATRNPSQIDCFGAAEGPPTATVGATNIDGLLVDNMVDEHQMSLSTALGDTGLTLAARLDSTLREAFRKTRQWDASSQKAVTAWLKIQCDDIQSGAVTVQDVESDVAKVGEYDKVRKALRSEGDKVGIKFDGSGSGPFVAHVKSTLKGTLDDWAAAISKAEAHLSTAKGELSKLRMKATIKTDILPQEILTQVCKETRPDAKPYKCWDDVPSPLKPGLADWIKDHQPDYYTDKLTA